MHIIRLKGISKRIKIGFNEEKQRGTRIEVDVEIYTDLSNVAKSDSLKGGIDYTKIYNIVYGEMKRELSTIESLCFNIHSTLKNSFPGKKIRVIVRKPHPPLGGEVQSAEVEIEE